MAADAAFGGILTTFAVLKELLACPACDGELRLDEPPSQQVSASRPSGEDLPLRTPEPASQQLDRLLCTRCGTAYPIVDGIPVLTLEGMRD